MNDSDSDNPISKIKDEVIDEDKPIKKKKHKNKTPEKKVEDPENLTLTADKMMKKELNLLHAPVNMNVEVPETSGKGQISHKNKRVSDFLLYTIQIEFRYFFINHVSVIIIIIMFFLLSIIRRDYYKLDTFIQISLVVQWNIALQFKA